MRRRAFTLTELAVVVAIMGLVAGIGVVTFQAVRSDVEAERARANVNQVRVAQLRYAAIHGEYTACPNQLEGLRTAPPSSPEEAESVAVACPSQSSSSSTTVTTAPEPTGGDEYTEEGVDADPGDGSDVAPSPTTTPRRIVQVTAGPSTAPDVVSMAVGANSVGGLGALVLVAADGRDGCVGVVIPRFGAAANQDLFGDRSTEGQLCDARSWLPDGEYALGPLGPPPQVPATVPTTTTTLPLPTPEGALVGVKQIAAGMNYTCAVSEPSQVWCWGRNNEGQVGNGQTSQESVPIATRIAGLQATSVTTGPYMACAIRTGVRDVVCWGDIGLNSIFNLFDGSDASADNTGTPTLVPGLTNVVSVAVGAFEACAVRSNGSVWCWGLDIAGFAETGEIVRNVVPTRIASLPPATTITAGIAHFCVLANQPDIELQGVLWCWGDNNYGQLGIPSPQDNYYDYETETYVEEGVGLSGPVSLAGRGLVGLSGVSASAVHTCITAAGQTACFGQNDFGNLGVGTTEHVPEITVVDLPEAVTQVSAGNTHTCVVAAQNSIWCWGGNFELQLNAVDGGFISEVPVAVDAGGATAVSAGFRHTCVITVAGGAWCWGGNTYGELGNAQATSDPLSAVEVLTSYP